MSGPRTLILHGWRGSGPEHWQHWLRDRLTARGVHVQFPSLPDCYVPCPDRWAATLHDELARLAAGAGARVVVCHSLGCLLWLREAAGIAPEYRVDRVALVAPPCPSSGIRELAPFSPVRADRQAVALAAARTELICSDDDPYCPGEGAADVWGRRLALPVRLIPGAGHLNVDAGYGPWPEIEAWVTDAASQAQAPGQGQGQGAKNGAEM